MDGQTGRWRGMTKLRVTFRNFTNAPKQNCCFLNCWITKFIVDVSRYFGRSKIWIWCKVAHFSCFVHIKVTIMNFSCNKINTDWLPKQCTHVFVDESTALEGLGLCVVPLLHSHTAHSVGLVCTSYLPVAESCTWQHTTLTRDRPPCPRRDPNP
jgi:hypothetical protein